MRFSRTYRAILVLLLVGLVGGLGPALNRGAALLPPSPPPTMQSYLDYDQQVLKLEAFDGMRERTPAEPLKFD